VTAAQQTGCGHGLRAPVVRFLETAFISVSNPFIFKENTAQTCVYTQYLSPCFVKEFSGLSA
jgi:hypothetical protein